MLYPTTMNQHGPVRSLDEYLDHLCAELEKERENNPFRLTARKVDLRARIRDLEAEIAARSRT